VVIGPEYYDGSKNPTYRGPVDIGKIYFEILFSQYEQSRSTNTTRPAYPMFSFIKQLPLVSEIVLVVRGPSFNMNDSIDEQELYYFPPFALWRLVNNNAFPDLNEYADFLNDLYTQPGFSNDITNDEPPSLPMGYTFQEAQVDALRAFEGDTIIESRFGSSIRFGSTVRDSSKANNWSKTGSFGNPITIIRNGPALTGKLDVFETITENINTDASAIWLTNGQEITINNYREFPLRSFGVLPVQAATANTRTTVTAVNDKSTSTSLTVPASVQDQVSNRSNQ
jgi:hypothetical protein